MIAIDGLRFRPIENSRTGRVNAQTIFHFAQDGAQISARYAGGGVAAGHIIGVMGEGGRARLLYHSRSDDDVLQAGEAEAVFSETDWGVQIAMDWRWLTGNRASGQSLYRQIFEAAP